MSHTIVILSLVAAFVGAPDDADKDKPDKSQGATPALSCKLLTLEAPRGGLLEVQGEGFGKTPLVRIGSKVTRIVERQVNKVSVQIPRDSNGGKVTMQSGKQRASCGTLTIIGKNG